MLYPDFNDLISYKSKRLRHSKVANYKVSSYSSGNHQSPFRGQGLDFDSVRNYVPGDDIRNIDWKVTARTGSAHLKLFKEEKERHTFICVDMNSSMRFGTRNTFKSIQAARCASLLGWRSLDCQDRVGACLFGDVAGGVHYFTPKRTQQALSMMLKALTEPPKETHPVPLETVLQHVSRVAHPGALIYIISDFMDLDGNFDALSRLSKTCKVIFISINDPADQTLVQAGLIGFCGKEKVYINTDNSKERQTYKALWEENRQKLNTLTKRFKIPLITLSTESTIHQDLILGLKNGTAQRH